MKDLVYQLDSAIARRRSRGLRNLRPESMDILVGIHSETGELGNSSMLWKRTTLAMVRRHLRAGQCKRSSSVSVGVIEGERTMRGQISVKVPSACAA